MKEYKIGDTVWTRKRGKCRVICEGSGVPNRPYRIMNDNGCFFYPKAENLYPSEFAMNLDVANRNICAAFGVPRKTIPTPNPIIFREAYTCGYFDIKPDPIQPKFKVGDAVYYKGKKYTIREMYWSGEKWKYNMTKPIGAESGNLLIGMNESDLRLWKETVLTHCLQIDGKTWYESDWEVLGYKSIKYLGNIVKHDTFLVESHGGNLNLFRGIKGDDI